MNSTKVRTTDGEVLEFDIGEIGYRRDIAYAPLVDECPYMARAPDYELGDAEEFARQMEIECPQCEVEHEFRLVGLAGVK